MTTIYAQTKEHQARAAQEFGAMLRRWREANGWTQYTAQSWAAEAGLEAIVHSGLSELERGLTQNPRVGLFLSLGNLNALVHASDYRGVRSRKLKDQLDGSRAICGDDGSPWGPAQFWACRAGLLAPPDWLAPPPANPAPVLTAEQAEQLSQAWAEQSRQVARATGAGRAGLDLARQAAPGRHRDRFADVLAGLEVYSPAQLAELWDAEASEWLPAQWLSTWEARLTPAGGGVSRHSERSEPEALPLTIPSR